MLTILVVTSWICLLVWGATSANRGAAFWAVMSFVLSQTTYVPAVAVRLAVFTGSAHACDQFENVWGLLSAFAVVAFLVVDRRADAITTLVVALGASVLLVVLGAVEEPDPTGCISTLATPVPWTSLYWWLLVVVHVGSSLLATVVIARTAARWRHDNRVFCVAMALFGLAFGSSTLFWLANGMTLWTEQRGYGLVAASSVFPVTAAATSAALVLAAISTVVHLYRTWTTVRALEARWVEQERRLRPAAPTPDRESAVGLWWNSPSEAVHQWRMRIADNELALGDAARTVPPQGGPPLEPWPPERARRGRPRDTDEDA